MNPFKRSVRTQLIGGVALVHAVLMTFFVGDMIHKQAHILYQEVQEGTKNVVQSFAQGISMWLATGDYQAVQDALDSMTEQFSNFQTVLVMDREGRILAHNIPKYVGQFVSDSISLSVLRQDRSQARYQVLKMNDRGLDVVAPVKLNNQLVGWVRVQRKLDTLSEQQNKIIWEGVFYTLFAIVVGSLLAWWLARRLTYRLERLRQATEQVASGQWNVTVPDESDYQDELAQLSRHFAMMLKQLQVHRQQY
ncbi:MAG TPA: HAMP domain-containing protein, partial [Piscirickettsiaceae bacterium]|nr:HAMP domain-containing protein [Piscirickettsiaceae bacterium]